MENRGLPILRLCRLRLGKELLHKYIDVSHLKVEDLLKKCLCKTPFHDISCQHWKIIKSMEPDDDEIIEIARVHKPSEVVDLTITDEQCVDLTQSTVAIDCLPPIVIGDHPAKKRKKSGKTRSGTPYISEKDDSTTIPECPVDVDRNPNAFIDSSLPCSSKSNVIAVVNAPTTVPLSDLTSKEDKNTKDLQDIAQHDFIESITNSDLIPNTINSENSSSSSNSVSNQCTAIKTRSTVRILKKSTTQVTDTDLQNVQLIKDQIADKMASDRQLLNEPLKRANILKKKKKLPPLPLPRVPIPRTPRNIRMVPSFEVEPVPGNWMSVPMLHPVVSYSFSQSTVAIERTLNKQFIIVPNSEVTKLTRVKGIRKFKQADNGYKNISTATTDMSVPSEEVGMETAHSPSSSSLPVESENSELGENSLNVKNVDASTIQAAVSDDTQNDQPATTSDATPPSNQLDDALLDSDPGSPAEVLDETTGLLTKKKGFDQSADDSDIIPEPKKRGFDQSADESDIIPEPKKKGFDQSADESDIIPEPKKRGFDQSADESDIIPEPKKKGFDQSADESDIIPEPKKRGFDQSADESDIIPEPKKRGFDQSADESDIIPEPKKARTKQPETAEGYPVPHYIDVMKNRLPICDEAVYSILFGDVSGGNKLNVNADKLQTVEAVEGTVEKNSQVTDDKETPIIESGKRGVEMKAEEPAINEPLTMKTVERTIETQAQQTYEDLPLTVETMERDLEMKFEEMVDLPFTIEPEGMIETEAQESTGKDIPVIRTEEKTIEKIVQEYYDKRPPMVFKPVRKSIKKAVKIPQTIKPVERNVEEPVERNVEQPVERNFEAPEERTVEEPVERKVKELEERTVEEPEELVDSEECSKMRAEQERIDRELDLKSLEPSSVARTVVRPQKEFIVRDEATQTPPLIDTATMQKDDDFVYEVVPTKYKPQLETVPDLRHLRLRIGSSFLGLSRVRDKVIVKIPIAVLEANFTGGLKIDKERCTKNSLQLRTCDYTLSLRYGGDNNMVAEITDDILRTIRTHCSKVNKTKQEPKPVTTPPLKMTPPPLKMITPPLKMTVKNNAPLPLATHPSVNTAVNVNSNIQFTPRLVPFGPKATFSKPRPVMIKSKNMNLMRALNSVSGVVRPAKNTVNVSKAVGSNITLPVAHTYQLKGLSLIKAVELSQSSSNAGIPVISFTKAVELSQSASNAGIPVISSVHSLNNAGKDKVNEDSTPIEKCIESENSFDIGSDVQWNDAAKNQTNINQIVNKPFNSAVVNVVLSPKASPATDEANDMAVASEEDPKIGVQTNQKPFVFFRSKNSELERVENPSGWAKTSEAVIGQYPPWLCKSIALRNASIRKVMKPGANEGPVVTSSAVSSESRSDSSECRYISGTVSVPAEKVTDSQPVPSDSSNYTGTESVVEPMETGDVSVIMPEDVALKGNLSTESTSGCSSETMKPWTTIIPSPETLRKLDGLARSASDKARLRKLAHTLDKVPTLETASEAETSELNCPESFDTAQIENVDLQPSPTSGHIIRMHNETNSTETQSIQSKSPIVLEQYQESESSTPSRSATESTSSSNLEMSELQKELQKNLSSTVTYPSGSVVINKSLNRPKTPLSKDPTTLDKPQALGSNASAGEECSVSSPSESNVGKFTQFPWDIAQEFKKSKTDFTTQMAKIAPGIRGSSESTPSELSVSMSSQDNHSENSQSLALSPNLTSGPENSKIAPRVILPRKVLPKATTESNKIESQLLLKPTADAIQSPVVSRGPVPINKTSMPMPKTKPLILRGLSKVSSNLPPEIIKPQEVTRLVPLGVGTKTLPRTLTHIISGTSKGPVKPNVNVVKQLTTSSSPSPGSLTPLRRLVKATPNLGSSDASWDHPAAGTVRNISIITKPSKPSAIIRMDKPVIQFRRLIQKSPFAPPSTSGAAATPKAYNETSRKTLNVTMKEVKPASSSSLILCEDVTPSGSTGEASDSLSGVVDSTSGVVDNTPGMENTEGMDTTDPLFQRKWRAFQDWKNCVEREPVSGNIPLHNAVLDNNMAAVRKQCNLLVAKKMTVDWKNTNLVTPLHMAIMSGNSDAIAALRHFGARLNVMDGEGNNALHLATAQRNPDVLPQLVAQMLPNEKVPHSVLNHDGYAPLHLCAIMSNEYNAKIICGLGADVDQRDGKSGSTALFIAVDRNHVEVERVLLEYNASTTEANFAGHTPLQAAGEISWQKKQALEMRKVLEPQTEITNGFSDSGEPL